MDDSLSTSAQKVQRALQTFGLRLQVQELSQTTRSAAEAAQAIGCQVGQIAKSLIFKTRTSSQPVLVIASGANRVNEKILARDLGEKIERADADFVRRTTGFVIGGVPPVGHTQPIKTYLDEDLWQYETIWAAAGTPFAVFQLTPANLQQITGGKVMNIT